MWYFAWVLGVTLAALAAVLNGMWLEMHLEDEAARARTNVPPGTGAAPEQPAVRPSRQ